MKKLTDITPPHMRGLTGACPAIFKMESGSYVIIGKLVTSLDYPDLFGMVGAKEEAIEISAAVFDDVVKQLIANSQPCTQHDPSLSLEMHPEHGILVGLCK